MDKTELTNVDLFRISVALGNQIVNFRFSGTELQKRAAEDLQETMEKIDKILMERGTLVY